MRWGVDWVSVESVGEEGVHGASMWARKEVGGSGDGCAIADVRKAGARSGGVR